MFRWRRRDGADEPDETSYPASDEELAESDYVGDEYEGTGEYEDAGEYDGEGEGAPEYEGAAEYEGADSHAAAGGGGYAGQYAKDEEDDEQYAEDEGYAEDEQYPEPAHSRFAVATPDGDGHELRSQEGRPARADLGDPDTWTRLRDSQPAQPAMARTAGPWDSTGEYPDEPRIDFGSMLVPVREGYDVQVMMSAEEGISIAVVRGDSGLQLQPFAAPRSSGLWHEVMPEIAQEVAKVGGQSSEQDGPFGPELVATVVPQDDGGEAAGPQPLRFMGADGPRWFLRGLINGPAATDTRLSEPFREIFADVVVVRGEHAEPPRKPLEIRLPEEARQVLEGQVAEGQMPGGQVAGQDEGNGYHPLGPGQQISETR